MIQRLATTGLSLMFLSGCMNPRETDNIDTAQQYLGLQERQHRTELKEILGIDPVRTEWCAAFVNAVLEAQGTPNLNDQTKYPPLMARSFLHWGLPVAKNAITRGDLVIFPRGREGWKGHVGFYVQTTADGYWLILGGNQDKSVKYSLYDPRKALGVRRWIPGMTTVQ